MEIFCSIYYFSFYCQTQQTLQTKIQTHFKHFKQKFTSKLNKKTTNKQTSEVSSSINQTVHLWEYDSMDHRAEVRKALVGDKEWQSNYMDAMRPLLVSQENLILKKFPWSTITVPEKDGNIFELRMYRLHPGVLNKWAERFQKVLLPNCYVSLKFHFSIFFLPSIQGLPVRLQYSKPYGVFFSEIGTLNQVVHLWPYKNYGNRSKVRDDATADPIWAGTVAETMPFIQEMKNFVVNPLPFSPLK